MGSPAEPVIFPGRQRRPGAHPTQGYALQAQITIRYYWNEKLSQMITLRPKNNTKRETVITLCYQLNPAIQEPLAGNDNPKSKTRYQN
jgi:hypothetical protein